MRTRAEQKDTFRGVSGDYMEDERFLRGSLESLGWEKSLEEPIHFFIH
jgi:hypothetical protein